MKRFASTLLLSVVAIFSFLAGAYFFFPRDAALGFLWRKGVLIAAERGINLELAALSVEGYFPFRIILRNLRVSSPLASMEAGTATIAPLFAASIFSFSPAADIRLEQLSLTLPLPGQPPLFFSSFSSRGSLYSSGVAFSEIRTAGDLEISGWMDVNPSLLRLDEADLSIQGERAALLEYVRTMLPLKKEASGAWTMKKGGKKP